MNAENAFGSFVTLVRNHLDDINDRELNVFLDNWPAAPHKLRRASPNHLPVLSFLPAALAAAHDQSRHLVQRLVALSPVLRWGQTYSAADFGAAFLQRYGWTELIGRRGPVPSDRIACGFLLLGSEVEYPRHCHEAREVYIPLTHQTSWQRKHQPWTTGAAGKPRHHAPWEWHAMRTGSCPLVALYLWFGGNLTQKSRVEKKSATTRSKRRSLI